MLKLWHILTCALRRPRAAAPARGPADPLDHPEIRRRTCARSPTCRSSGAGCRTIARHMAAASAAATAGPDRPPRYRLRLHGRFIPR
jgi:hypothetical protein